MNRSLVHELLIEKISAGDVRNGEEILNLIYQNQILESEISAA
jgi:hypothetical protein